MGTEGRLQLPPGSSPLTRGKRLTGARVRALGGLIPAHAGKTTTTTHTSPASPAHPRSRGENPLLGVILGQAPGSSPLTRGKLAGTATSMSRCGLIPAHAGKTEIPGFSLPSQWAHPRSRGENSVSPPTRRSQRGSSPLTRGKPLRVRATGNGQGLIPAHAGKTEDWRDWDPTDPAHPRSRGENFTTRRETSGRVGSSPLTRGKRGPGRGRW